MSIIIKNGNILLSPSGGFKVGYDAAAPNNPDWGAATIVTLKILSDELSEFYVTVDQVPAGVVQARLQIVNQTTSGVVRDETYPMFTPIADTEVFAGSVKGQATLDVGWVASLIPFDSSGRAGLAGATLTTTIVDLRPPPSDVDVTNTTAPALVAGTQLSPVSFTPGVYTGTVLTKTHLWEDSTNGTTGWATIIGSSSEALTTWPDDTRAYARVTEIVTGHGIATTLNTTSNVVAITPNAEEPLKAPEYEMTSYIAFTGTNTYVKPALDMTNKPLGQYGIDWWINWSTDSQFPPRPQEVESGVNATVEVPPGVYEIHMDQGGVDDGDPNSQNPRANYSVFQSTSLGVVTETTRAASFQVQYQTPTQVGPWAAKRIVPDVAHVEIPTTPLTSGGWARLGLRTQEQHRLNQFGGVGMQFFRGIATSATSELIIGGLDVDMPHISENFGGTFSTPRCIVNSGTSWRSCSGAWIDPTNDNRWLMLYSGEGAYWPTDGSADGIFLTTDRGDTFTKVLNHKVLSTTIDRTNNQYRRIAHDPTTSGSNRNIYALICSGDNGTSTNYIKIWRSTDNGSSFTEFGPNLSAATYASGENCPNWIGFSSDGQLFMSGPKGMWVSSDKGLTANGWTQIRSSRVNWADVAQGTGSSVTVWAAQNDGLYKSTNTGGSFTKNAGLGTYSCRHFALHTANRSQIYTCGDGVSPKVSINGGSSWNTITSLPMPGQEGNFESDITKEMSSFWPHPTDPQQVFVCRFQHLGKSVNAHMGGTGTNAMVVDHAGLNFDGLDVLGIASHPTDWRKFAIGTTDRVSMYFYEGGLWAIGDAYSGTNDVGAAVAAALGTTGNAKGAGTIMTSSDLVVTVMGRYTGARIVMATDDPENGDNNVNSRYAANHIEVYNVSAGESKSESAIDPLNSNRGWLGTVRVVGLNAGNAAGMTVTNIGKKFQGCSVVSGTTYIYGVTTGSDKVIYRSSDGGTNYNAWYTTVQSFRPTDNRFPAVICDPTAHRVYAASHYGNGRVVKIEGSSPSANSEKVIFDPKMAGRGEYMAPEVLAGHPRFFVGGMAVDPNDPETLYVAMAMSGVSARVFMSRNARSGTGWTQGSSPGVDAVTWTDISEGVYTTTGIIWVHPITSDVIIADQHGRFVRSAPSDIRQSLSTTPYAFSRNNTGTGTVTGITGAKEGAYVLLCTTGGGNVTGKFSVTDPDNNNLGTATVGTAFSHSEIGFTINDGNPDFVVGDRFVIATSIHDIHRDFIRGIV